jgi:hypothetical protein
MDAPQPPDAHPTAPRGRAWLKRFGVAGFMFFLIKGLLWLALPTLLVSLGVGC